MNMNRLAEVEETLYSLSYEEQVWLVNRLTRHLYLPNITPLSGEAELPSPEAIEQFLALEGVLADSHAFDMAMNELSEMWQTWQPDSV